MALYSDKVMDHFMNPRNVGEIADADGVGEVGNAKCGDIMKMYLKIKDGKIDQKKLKKLRFTGDDILDQLRQKDIFDINEVQYAVIETNGSLSVMKNPENETPTVSQFGFKTEKRGIPVLAVNDGRYIDTAINESEEISKKTVEKILKKENADVKEVLIMLIDKYGNYTIIKKDEN